ncbi:MAG: gamma-glutamylcyclotransferase family protein [Bacteroidota bacterium]
MNEYLFSYGTLQQEKVQLDLFGRILQGSIDTLKGYKIAPIEIRDKIFLAKGAGKNHLIAIETKDSDDKITGTVLELTEEELLSADKYEPEEYIRVAVILESGKRAWIYTSTSGEKK